MQDTNTIPDTCTSNYAMSKMIYFHPSKLGEYLKKIYTTDHWSIEYIFIFLMFFL